MQHFNVPALPPAPPPALPAGRKHRLHVLKTRTAERLASIVELFSRNHLFQRCTREQLGFLAATAYPVSFEAGDALCVEGTYAPACYVVAAGRATVTIERHRVGAVAACDVVGERGILLDTVQAATVTARMHMETCAIARERLQTLVEDSRALRSWMLEDVLRHYPVAVG